MQCAHRTRALHPQVDFIVLNNTRRPTTGGDYVYAVMKDELIHRGYYVSEISIPSLVERVASRISNGPMGQVYTISAEAIAYLRCYLSSLKDFSHRSRMIITSSCPTFPVFGHLTYHQPKAGICTDFIRQGDNSLKRMIGYRMQENDKLSPLWLLAKKLIPLHLSNSVFTKGIVKEIYGLESTILYPPVPVTKYLKINLRTKRKPYVYITRPQAITGILSLPEIAKHLPKNVKLIITGKLDEAGKKALHVLKSSGIAFEYLGFVEEQVKMEILSESSVYINLAVNETFGITVVEALAAGCLAVAHKSGSIPEFLPTEFQYSDINECAEKVAKYIGTGSELREQLRSISMNFDEAIFRKDFMFFVNQLEFLLKLDLVEKKISLFPSLKSDRANGNVQ